MMSDRQGFRKAASERAAAEDFIREARERISTARNEVMCPHCGKLFAACLRGLIPDHGWSPTYQVCPGSQQIPRNPESDGRPLWNGESNPHFYRNQL